MIMAMVAELDALDSAALLRQQIERCRTALPPSELPALRDELKRLLVQTTDGGGGGGGAAAGGDAPRAPSASPPVAGGDSSQL